MGKPGSPIAFGRVRPSLEEMARIDKYVVRDPESGCWVWIGRVDTQGFPVFWYRKRVISARRAVYGQYKGMVPKQRLVTTCGEQSCVNPEHVVPHTAVGLVHADRGYVSVRCPEGHLIAGENVKLERQGNGRARARCRRCQRVAQAASHKRRQRARKEALK